MGKKSANESFYGGISHRQYEWLRARMEHDSDNEASRACGVPIDTAKSWHDSPSFSALHELVLTDPIKALPLLSLHLASKALKTVERLLDSESVGGMRAGFSAWKELVDIAIREKTDESLNPNVLIQILNARGTIADNILEATSAMEPHRVQPPPSAGGNTLPPNPSIVEGEWQEVPGRDDGEAVRQDNNGGSSIMDGATIARRFIRPPKRQADSPDV